jgi:hypothetical protein
VRHTYWALTECANVTQNEWGKTSKLKIRMLTHSYPKLSFDIELAASYRLFIITGANSSMIPVGSQSYLVRIRSSAWDH